MTGHRRPARALRDGFLRACVALGAGSLVLTACSSDDPDTAGGAADESDEPLQVWVRQVDDGLKVFEDLAAAFEAETGNEVEVFSAVNDFEQRLLRAGAGNDLPDMFFNDNASSWQFVDAGIIEEIERDDITNGADIAEPAWDSVKGADGAYYGVPFTINIFQLYVRSDWREAVGRDVPQNWDDLVDLAAAFTVEDPDGNGQDDTYGFNVPASTERGYASWFWSTYLWQAGGDYLHANDDGTFEVAINEPEAVAALGWFQGLQCEAKVVQPNAVNTVTVDAIPNMTEGLTGMYMAGVQMFARFDEAPGADAYEAIAPPPGSANDLVMTESSNAYIIKGTDKAQTAREFADFAASEAGQLVGMNPGGFGIVQIPVNTKVDAVTVYDDERWEIPMSLYENNAKFFPSVPNWTPFRQTSADTVNTALADCSADPQALLDDLADTFQAELESQGVAAG